MQENTIISVKKVFSLKTIIALIFILMMTSTSFFVLPVDAQTALPSGVTPTNVQDGGSIALPAGVTPGIEVEPTVYLSFSPNPIGVNQPLLVNIWMQPPTHVSLQLKGFIVTFIKPKCRPMPKNDAHIAAFSPRHCKPRQQLCGLTAKWPFLLEIQFTVDGAIA